MYRPSPAMKREKMFLARVELLPVTFRSHTVTDKCKISIMIASYGIIDHSNYTFVCDNIHTLSQYNTRNELAHSF